MIEFLRKILLAGVSGDLEEYTFDLDEELEKKVEQYSKEIDSGKIIKWVELFIEKKRELKAAEIEQLPLEMAIIEITNSVPVKVSKAVDFNKGSNKITQEQRDNIKRVTSQEASTEKDSQEKKVENTNNKTINFGLEKIKEQWSNILRVAAEKNPSLVLILRVGQPVAVEDGVLQIGFKYRFHKERINEEKNNQILRRLTKEVLGEGIGVAGVIADIPEPEETPPIEVDKVLEEFGGKVVE